MFFLPPEQLRKKENFLIKSKEEQKIWTPKVYGSGGSTRTLVVEPLKKKVWLSPLIGKNKLLFGLSSGGDYQRHH